MHPHSLDEAIRQEIDDLLDVRATAAEPSADEAARWEALSRRLEIDAETRGYLAERALLHAALARSLPRRRRG